MGYSNLTLPELMASPLPSLTQQKRLCFRPPVRLVHHVYELLNYYVYGNELRKPIIEVAGRRRSYWGMCVGHMYVQRTGSYCSIQLMDKWISIQWMIATLAHEMAHQYQWDVLGPERHDEGKDFLMSHGPSFFMFRDSLEQFQIPLKVAHSQRRWYKHQDLFKT